MSRQGQLRISLGQAYLASIYSADLYNNSAQTSLSGIGASVLSTISLPNFNLVAGGTINVESGIAYLNLNSVGPQGLRITIANLGYMGSFVSRANPDFCRTVLRLSDSIVTNTAHCYLRNSI